VLAGPAAFPAITAKRGGADEPALTGVAALIWPAIRLAEEIG
jgi:hypothetical protein